MSKTPSLSAVEAQQRRRALAGWKNEGGAGPCGPPDLVASRDLHILSSDMGLHRIHRESGR